MGQIINFIKSSSNSSSNLSDDSLLNSIIKLVEFSNDYFVFVLKEEDFEDSFSLSILLKQLLLLNRLNIKFSIICPLGMPNLTRDSNVELLQSVSLKSDGYLSKLSNEISNLGGVYCFLFAFEGKIMTIDNVVKENKSLADHNNSYNRDVRIAKVESNFLLEINKTAIIPIILPICFNSKKEKVVIDGLLLGCSIASSFNNNRIVYSSNTQEYDLNHHICGIEKFSDFLKRKDKVKYHNLINAMSMSRNKIEYFHLLDFSNSPYILNDITFNSSSGILLYNDAEDV